ncbi:MAG TPA: hypothetical protein PLD77_02515 [Candidatus Dojkabacteria bacterium]|nr:hypothetical protein [Candidatus Dojkabacteria bacterium]
MNIQFSEKSEEKIKMIKYYCNILFESEYYKMAKKDNLHRIDHSFDNLDIDIAMIQAYTRFRRPQPANPPNTPLATVLALAYQCRQADIMREINARIIVLEKYLQYDQAVFMLVRMDYMDFAVDPGEILGYCLFQSLTSLSQYDYVSIGELDLESKFPLSHLFSKINVLA